MRRQRQDALAIIIALILAIGAGLLLPLLLAGPRGDAAADSMATAATPPPVEPVRLMALTPDDARSRNAAQPFVPPGFPAAAPFRFTGDGTASARAVDCMAAAQLYEAGDDAEGQRAVAQVVINRARHPAYPKTICGVVFQGSERASGCQFTFTCDGALARHISEDAWQRARGIAIDMLNGAVYRPVGLATHYHTDWVRPYWSPSLEKLAQVGSHLFFRWPGFWGSPRAMTRRVTGQEPAIAQLALLSPAHAAGLDPSGGAPSLLPAAPVDPRAVRAAVSSVIPQGAAQLGDTIILTLHPDQSPDSYPALAQAACGERRYCKVMGWTHGAPLPSAAISPDAISDAARATMGFSYLRDRDRGLERALWNCNQFPQIARRQCMRR